MAVPTSSINSFPLDNWNTFPSTLELKTSNSSTTAQSYVAVVVAQSEGDVLSDIGGAFRGFYESGQLWALLIGLVLGYIVRGITTYQ
ncbi:MAG: hypothetical protein AAFQ89_08165 [Cyanobacteria bacterium J06626_18]